MRRSFSSNPWVFGILLRFQVWSISIQFPFKSNSFFPRVLVQNLLFEHISKGLMPFETFVYAHHKQFFQSCIFVSSICGFLKWRIWYARAVEEFVAIEAFDDSGEELAVSRSMHLRHGGVDSTWAALICWASNESFSIQRSSWDILNFSRSSFLWRNS